MPSQPGLQMLRKGDKKSDNHRVRADFLEGKDHAKLEATATGELDVYHSYSVIKPLKFAYN